MGSGPSIAPPRPVDYEKDNHFVNADGLRIFTRCWPAKNGPARALAFLGHGLSEHCSRPGYETLANRLADSGVTVIAHDHVGHGRSEGARSDVGDFAVYARDVISHVQQKRSEITNVPVYLIGHSMSGTVSCLIALQRPDLVDGLVLSAPALEPFPDHVGFMSRYILPIVAFILPHEPVRGSSPPELNTRNEEQVALSNQDPFYYKGATKARWANAFFNAVSVTSDNMANINLPFLIAHGSADKLTNIDGSRHLYERAKSSDKTLEEIPEAVHSLLHEIPECQEKVIDLFVRWIDTRAARWHDCQLTASGKESSRVPPSVL